MTRTIKIVHDHAQTPTHDGKHEYLVRPGKFQVNHETSVVFRNETGHAVTVNLPPDKPTLKDGKQREVSLPQAPAGELELEYTVDVHATPPDNAHGDHSNPRIVYP